MFAARLVNLGWPSAPLWIRAALFLFASLSIISSARPQTTSQRVYAAQPVTTTSSVVSGYSKDGATGALSALSASPTNERLEGGLLAIDGQGKFLFVLNPQSNNISMFQIDASSGSLTEVPNSPFSVGPTINPNNAPSLPISIAAEPSGHYLYVGYAIGNVFPNAAITPLAIDAANRQLTLTPALSFDIPGSPVQMLSDPKGLRLYVGLGPNTQSGQRAAGATVYAIDAPTGALFLNGSAGGGSDTGRAIAIDPQGRFFFDGWGQNIGFLDSGLISPVDGTSSPSATINLGVSDLPSILLVDSSSKFLYAGTSLGLVVYSIDQNTGQLTQSLGPLSGIPFDKGHAVADPAGAFLYSLDARGIHSFQIDSQTGALSEISGSPFNAGSGGAVGALGLAITAVPTQNVVGPVASVFPTTSDLGQATVGHPSITRVISVVNTGDQTLAVTAITITGPNAADFSQTNTCVTPLSPNSNCSVSIGFTPSVVGVEHATLNVSDNAPGSPQAVPLIGTGVAAQSAVTAVPGSIDFGSLALGATTQARSFSITNSGQAPLHVSNIALGGANPSDFSQTNNCTVAPIAVQSSCTISISFVPQAQGQRTATTTLTDDAPDTPQSYSISGSAVSPFQLTAGTSGSTSATISAGQTAQFQLQLTPAPGYNGTVSFACMGAPQNSTCTVNPGSISASGGVAAPFMVSVATKGSASSFLTTLGTDTTAQPRKPLPWSLLMLVLLTLALARFATNATKSSSLLQARRLGFVPLSCALLFAGIAVAGCGGGTSATVTQQTPPPTIVTPSGTTTITVTATAGSLPAQSIPLTLTVR